MNIADLLQIDREIKQYMQSVRYMLKPQIEEFNNKYNAKIMVVNTHIFELQKKYFVFENNRIKTVKTDKGQEKVLLEGMTHADYNKELGDILSSPVE